MSSSGSITPLPLDPELFGELLEKVPAEVIEQLTDNWRKQTEALARSQKENRLFTGTVASDAGGEVRASQ